MDIVLYRPVGRRRSRSRKGRRVAAVEAGHGHDGLRRQRFAVTIALEVKMSRVKKCSSPTWVTVTVTTGHVASPSDAGPCHARPGVASLQAGTVWEACFLGGV
ncbi:hypothetical protein B0H13DRAFT_1872081 [Mycena leptocephala]|nr:hypothetical protein B0H13DRAFT_1872081 [Mycena leptocephala]